MANAYNIRNAAYIQHDDPRYHEAFQDVLKHMTTMKAANDALTARVSELEKARKK